MKFYTGDQFPRRLVQEHTLHRRTRLLEPAYKYQGARIKRVIVGPDGKNAKQEIFASGWLEGDQGYLGRPADIVLAKDGSMLVADDWAGAIYRISYKKYAEPLQAAVLEGASRGFFVSTVIPGRCASIEPGTSRFRVWSFGPSRNDERDGILDDAQLRIACIGYDKTLAASPPRAADIAAGKAKAELCVDCHGQNGISETENIPSLAGQPDQFIQWQLVYFRAGARKNEDMQPIVEQLNNEDIRNLGAYFASLAPPKKSEAG